MKSVRMLSCLLIAAAISTALFAQVDARLLQEPAVSAAQVAFIYAGDIWVAPREGGLAQRLSTPAGSEHFPRFSPDGSQIAFSANYDGNPDIYVVPALGGMPRRLTHHPEPDRMLAWFPDGLSLLFASPRASGVYRFSQLYRVSAGGGLPEKIDVPYGEFGAVSPDGKTLAYCPNSQDGRTWKRYRGGDVSRIWLFDLQTRQGRRVGGDEANYTQPMWRGNTLYFLSDRDTNKRYNLWAMDLSTGAMRALTAFERNDIHFPSMGPDVIVFENAGRMYLLDLGTEKTREISIRVVTDEESLKPRVEKVGDRVAESDVSPSGKRSYFEARGEIFSVPAEHGPSFDLTRTPGVAERYPALSQDGKTLAYWSDRTGEYELTLRASDGSGGERTVTRMGPGYRYRIFWSPDGKRVAFIDQAMRINLCDLATGHITEIDRGLWLFDEAEEAGHESLQGFTASWSADGRWVAWAREIESKLGAIFLYDTKTGKKTQVTSGFYSDASPAFDPEGKYLYFLTMRHFKPVYSGLDATWIYANMIQIAAVPLRASVPSPLAPRNDVEESPEKAGRGGPFEGSALGATSGQALLRPPAGETDAPSSAKPADEKAPKSPKPEPVEIDLQGFEGRVVLLPPPPGNYAGLAALPGMVLYRRLPLAGSDEDEKTPLVYYDLKEREEKTILADAGPYRIASGGEKILVRVKKDFFIVEAKPEQKAEKALAVGDLEMTVDPRAEWRQIFTDAWRFERDYFYDPRMHGVDWAGMRVRYGELLEQCVTRSDVNFVLGELIAELNSSHTYRGGGDLPKPAERGVGLLGADFVLENGAYRIAKILDGAPWDAEARSPLSEPGLGVKEGDYLLAVNGVPVDVRKDIWAAFDGLAGKPVLLTLNSRPSPEGAKQVLVNALESEERLRHLAWAQANRDRVAKASGGRLGYIFVPDTDIEGQTELYRQFMGQITRAGLVIDERFNAGGQIPDRFIELLDRPVLNYWGVRDGADLKSPEFGHGGPKVMLINGWSGSGGDCFPLYFRMKKLGPLVGRRTWGGLIGISGSPLLVDGGIVTVPTFGMYSAEGRWIVEGHGVEPDVDVLDDPALMGGGGDPQLDRAIAEALRLLDENPPKVPARPPYDDRSGK